MKPHKAAKKWLVWVVTFWVGDLDRETFCFNDFMIALYLPPFLVVRDDLVKAGGGITGDQIEYASAAVFVYEDLFNLTST